MLIDTHAHLNSEKFLDAIDETVARAHQAGIERIVVVGFDRETNRDAIKLADQYENIFAVVGWHPVDAIDFTEEDLQEIERLAGHEKVVAIGEMGLDYYWDKSPKEIQDEVFRKQIRLAKQLELPIVVHNRDATEDLMRILDEEGASEVGGIMHCFSGSVETAMKCIDMNFYISFAGPVTFKNAKQPKEVALNVPLDRILIETDCPYLAPHPHRGKQNEPAYVSLVAEEIATIKGLTYEEVAEATTDNAKRLLRMI